MSQSSVSSLPFALRSLTRDLRTGEIRVLALALIIAVASVTAVGFFTDRIGRAMERQAADVLAADLRIRAGQPLDPSIQTQALDRGLDTATTTQFPSVVLTNDDESQLVSVKAVSDGYPLRGTLSLARLDNTTESAPLAVPTPGSVWVDLQLMNTLSFTQGDVLQLGSREYTIERLIRFEPDRGENVFELAPRVMMNATDLEGSSLIGEGSRVRYALLMAGETGAIDDMRAWADDAHREDVTIEGVRDGSPQVNRALDRASVFLGLASVVTVLLAGAAIALAVRQCALKQADASAVMRTLGAARREVVAWLSWRLVVIALGASIIGIVVGYLAQMVLADLLKEWFRLALPLPGIKPPLIGLLTAFVTLAGFGLLPVVRAGTVPVMSVLQRDYTGLSASTWLVGLVGLVAAFFVVYLQSGNVQLSLIVIGGVVAMLSIFGIFGRAIIAGVRQLAGRRWRLSVAGLQRRAGSSVVQLSAFALGIMALLLISIVRVDVLKAWERDVPADAPNAFIVNIQPPQADPLVERLRGEGIDVPGAFPMVRARMVAINSDVTLRSDSSDEHQRRHARYEYNLTWSDTLPEASVVTKGEWWEPNDERPLLSLEQEWAERQGFNIGDTLTFRVGGQDTTGTVANFREVDWESFKVNFFAMGNAALLADMPHTFVTSFHIDRDFGAASSEWLRAFPGIVTLDVGAIIQRVKGLMERAALAVEYVFLFTLVAGVVVLLAAVQSSQGERIRESALLRSLGASHRQIRESILAEFAILGAISGFLAALFATIVAWAISRFVLELPFEFNPLLWVTGVVVGTLGISIAGYFATRKVMKTPPLIALRHT